MNSYYPKDPPKKLRGHARDLFLLHEQQKWIDGCEGNGVSYAGPRGPEIRRADNDALRRLETRAKESEGR